MWQSEICSASRIGEIRRQGETITKRMTICEIFVALISTAANSLVESSNLKRLVMHNRILWPESFSMRTEFLAIKSQHLGR
jgi:hypothetical protein